MIDITANITKYYHGNFTLLNVVRNEYSKEAKIALRSKTGKYLSKYSEISKSEIKISKDPVGYITKKTAEYDLLILGTPKKETWKSMLFGTGSDPLAKNANCSVLRLTIKNR